MATTRVCRPRTAGNPAEDALGHTSYSPPRAVGRRCHPGRARAASGDRRTGDGSALRHRRGSLPVDAIEQILGARGSVSAGVLSVSLDRTDIGPVKGALGVTFPPAFEIGGGLTFQPLGADLAFFNGDLALKPGELNPVIDAIQSGGPGLSGDAPALLRPGPDGVVHPLPWRRASAYARQGDPPRARRDRHVVVSDADSDDYDALVLPGGVANPDALRTDRDALGFVKAIFAAGKPVGVICHGPWTLVEADLVRGRTLTSWPSLRTDIVNAGGTWTDQEVVVDHGLVSSRKPDDLPAFCSKLIEEFAEGRHKIAAADAPRS
jgi:protease I